MFPLVETIKIFEGIPLHLKWHQRRMDYAFHILYGMDNPFLLNELITVGKEYCSGTVKCRFLYSMEGFKAEYSPYVPRKIKSLQMVVSNTIDYSHKYTNRKMIDDLLKLKGAADDILIIRDGLITDTSYANIVFNNGQTWITPDDPLLEGTCRNRLLAEGKIIGGEIRAEEIINYPTFKLINAMLDFEEQPEITTKQILLI